jgi:hypothetical protein
MRSRESRLEALRHVLAPHEGGDDTRRLMVANWVIDLTLDIAGEALPLLHYPLTSLVSGHVIGRWFHGAAMRTRPLEPIDTQRLQWHYRAAGWSHRILLEGVREGLCGALWSDLLDAEQLLRCTEEGPPSEQRVAALLDHPSHHVRGFGWLAALQLHELARPLRLDLERYADSEAPPLRVIAAWVLTSTQAREVPLAWLEEALADTAPRRIQEDALSLLRFIRPEPYRALAPKVAHIAKSEPGVWGVLCRIAPEVWRELLPITLETEPWVPGSRTRKHFETRGIRVPDARPTTRATHARMALREAAEWLPAEAVLALDSLLSHGDI